MSVAIKLSRIMINMTVSYSFGNLTLWSRGLTGPSDKIELLYVHYHSEYAHQSWQDSELPWRDPSYKLTWYPSITWPTKTVTMNTKLDGIVDYLEKLVAMKKYESFITRSCKITWQIRTSIYPLPLCLWSTNSAGLIVTYLNVL